MKLLRKPFRPTTLPFAPVIRPGKDVPPTWTEYLGGSARGAVADDEHGARVA